MKKRVFSILLCLVLCLTLFPVTALASAGEENVFYLQLSSAAQTAYDKMNSAESIAKMRSGQGVTFSYSGSYSSQADLEQQVQSHLTTLTQAFAAFEREHPEVFWINGCSQNGSYSYGTGRYDFPVTMTPRLAYNWSSGGRSIAEDEALLNAAVQKLAEEASVQGGPYEALLYVHDWLTKNNVYNEAAARTGSAGNNLPWTPLSALTGADRPVCEGYARAFKLVCDELGYPCILVDGTANGGPHMWNQVLLKGKWYAVDVTFDDPTIRGISYNESGYENRKFFLVGADTVVDGVRFASSHTTGTQRVSGVEFRFPALTSEAADIRSVSWLPDEAWTDPSFPGNGDEDPAGEDDPAGAFNPSDGEEYADAAPVPFTDMSPRDYFYDAVSWAYNADPQVAAGVDATHFGPSSTVTRGQAMAFLWRAMGKPEPKSTANPFVDVPGSAYYYKAVLWAVENGVTAGSDATHFSPDATLSTAHIVTFLYRAMGVGTGGYYAEATRWADEVGLRLNHYIEIDPAVNCPRADVVQLLYTVYGMQ